MTKIRHSDPPIDSIQGLLADAGLPDKDLNTVFAALPGIWLLLAADAPRFTMLEVSDERLAATLTKREATLGRPLFEVFPDANPDNPEPSGVGNLRVSLETVLRTRAPHRMPIQRYDLRREDGTWEERYWAPLNVPVPGPDGAVRFLLHHVQDATREVLGHQALARAEQRALRILEHVADAHFVLDSEFRFITLNPAAERMVGKSREALLGRIHWEMFPASINMDVGRAYRRVVVEGVEQHLQQHYVGDGYDMHLEIDAYPTEEGGVAVFTRDVTERVQGAEARRKGQAQRFLARLGDALRLPGDAGAVHAEAARLLSEHLGASHVVYRETADTSGKPGGAQDDPGPRPPASIAEQLRIEDYGPYVAEQLGTNQSVVVADVREIPRQQGLDRLLGEMAGMRACLVAPIVKDGHVVACMVVGQTVSRRWTADEVALVEEVAERTWAAAQRARADEALRLSEERYRTLFERMKEGFCTIEMLFDDAGQPVDYRFESVNPAFEQQTGLHGATGRRMRELAPQHEAHWFQVYGQVALTGEPVHFEAKAEALQRHFEAHAFRIGQPDEHRVAILFRDITQRKQAENALQALNAELERRVQERTAELVAARDAAEAATRAKSSFLAHMSHEFRTPLNAVIGLSQLLLQRPLAEDTARFVSHIHDAGEQLLGLTSDVLDLSRIEAGEMVLESVPFEPQVLLDTVLAMVSPQAQAKDLHLVADIDPQLPGRLVGDPLRLRQVLLNLLSNAVKFTTRGSVTLRARLLGHSGEWALLCMQVVDTGIGIAAEKFDRIFEPFAQADGSITRRYGGTGLGLSIVQRLATMMHATLKVESQPGQGSTFTLELALRKQTVSMDAGADAAP